MIFIGNPLSLRIKFQQMKNFIEYQRGHVSTNNSMSTFLFSYPVSFFVDKFSCVPGKCQTHYVA